MAHYFLHFCGTACTNAAEKAIYGYIKDHFDHAVISEAAIQAIASELDIQIDHYFLTHRGNRIRCSFYQGGQGYYINVGSLYMTAIKIEHEIGACIVKTA